MRRNTLIWALIALMATMAEATALFILPKDSWRLLAMYHGIISMCLVLLAVAYSRSAQTATPWLLCLLTACTGLFGAGLSFIAIVMGLFMRSSTPEELFEELQSVDRQAESAALYSRIIFGLDNAGSTGVEPLQDILASGNMLEKQAAIVKITRWFRPQFAPLLRLAANDVDAAVRVQAATAIAKIERDYMLRYLQLEESVKKNTSIVKERKLARLCYEFALSGIVDEETANQLSRRAIELYSMLLEKGQDVEAVRLPLAKLYLENKQAREACALLDPLFKENALPFEGISLYMDALYQMQNYDQLRSLASNWQWDQNMPGLHMPEVDEVRMHMQLWTGLEEGQAYAS